MKLGSKDACTLAAGAALASVAMLLTHPVAVAACLTLGLVLARKADLFARSRAIMWAAVAIAASVLLFNGLFAWRGSTVLWQAPFRLSLVGRPRFTIEALAWGATAGGQLATTVLALGAATVAVPPEALDRAIERAGLPKSLARASSLALRLTPETTRDARAMRQALGTRGVDTSTLRGASQTLVPLAARSLDRAIIAEEALLVRGFDPDQAQTGWPPAGILAVLAAGIAALVAFLGPGRPAFYPALAIPMEWASLAMLAGALLVPALLLWEVPECSA